MTNMAKTKEELNQLKIEYEALNKKLNELTDKELAQVSGGQSESTSVTPSVPPDQGSEPVADSAPSDVGVQAN